MSTDTTAAEIAASIDTSTTEGHNLRALLLRLFDGNIPGASPPAMAAIAAARAAGFWGDLGLTTLGREVAELLRPRPWRAKPTHVQFYLDTYMGELFGPDGEREAEFHDAADANRAADLLTRDDLDKAKQYRTEPTS